MGGLFINCHSETYYKVLLRKILFERAFEVRVETLRKVGTAIVIEVVFKVDKGIEFLCALLIKGWRVFLRLDLTSATYSRVVSSRASSHLTLDKSPEVTVDNRKDLMKSVLASPTRSIY